MLTRNRKRKHRAVGWAVLIFFGLLCFAIPCSNTRQEGSSRQAQNTEAGNVTAAGSGPRLRAFSLREADRILEQGTPQEWELQKLGGITRFAGMVFDRQSADVILVGQARPDLCDATLDDLVVALRGVMKGEYPIVSIDATIETPKTLRQEVRFKGGIENSQFGADFLASDIILKQYSLDLLTPIEGIQTYLKICEDSVKKQMEREGHAASQVKWHSTEESVESLNQFMGKYGRQSQAVQSRFWFFNQDEFSHVTEVDDVYVIDELRLGVKVEILQSGRSDPSGRQISKARDEISERFAAQFTQHFHQACSKYPVLKRLKVLFDLLAISTGVAHLGAHRPALDHLLAKYRVQTVGTPREYPLLTKLGVIGGNQDKGSTLIMLSGGVELKPLLLELNDGVPSALRKIVLLSRPKYSSLTWDLPLEEWEMPNDELPDQSGQPRTKPDSNRVGQERKVGFSLTRQTFLLSGQPGLKGEAPFRGFPPPALIPAPVVPPMVLKPLNKLVPLSGVSMMEKIKEESIKKDPSGNLKKKRDEILHRNP